VFYIQLPKPRTFLTASITVISRLVAKEFNLVLILVHCFGFDDLFRKLGLDFYSWGLFMDHLARPRSRFYRTMPTITRLAVTGSMR
jgi:hypothetical protein